MGEASLDEAYRAAHTAQIPAYTFPEHAVWRLGSCGGERGGWRSGGAGEGGGAGEQGRGGEGRARHSVQQLLFVAPLGGPARGWMRLTRCRRRRPTASRHQARL